MKAIKPIIGKRDDLEILTTQTIPIIEDKSHDKSPNIMGSIDIVMNIWDEYSNRTHRVRNATTYVMDKAKDKNWNRDYIRQLRYLGNRLKDEGVYNQALHEDWKFVTITDFLRKQKKKTNNIKITETQIPEPKDTVPPSPLDDYLKKIRPGTIYR